MIKRKEGRMGSIVFTTSQFGALALSLVTSTIVFLRRLFVLNRVRWPLPTVHTFTFTVSLLSGVNFWITLNSIDRSLFEQLWFQTLSTMTSWLVVVLIINERAMYPTRQQWLSLVFYMLTELSIAGQLRLVVRGGGGGKVGEKECDFR